MLKAPFIALLLAAQVLAADSLSYPNESPSADQIAAYLTKKRSNLAGSGPLFIQEARKYDIDPRLIVAISGAESSFGRHICAAFNAWNWFHRRTCPQSPFNSYTEGITTVTKFLRRSYINKGYDTIPLIQVKYCPTPDCTHWVSNVTHFRQEIPVSASSVSPQPVPPTPVPVTPAPTPTAPLSTPSAPILSGNRLFGVPVYLVFFVAAGLVAWIATRGLARGR